MNLPDALSCHAKTQLAVKAAIATLIRKHAADKHDLLDIGAFDGRQTLVYCDQLDNPRTPVIYDWKDFRSEKVKRYSSFAEVDMEVDKFPSPDARFDVIVCNQVLEHIKNIYLPLSEMHRVLKLAGYLIVSVPNLAALHNCLLLCLGQQPTTINILGSHVRGYAIWAMSKFLVMNNHFRIIELHGYGLHPVTSRRIPGLLRTFCHTPIWLLRKEISPLPIWEDWRKETFTTTYFPPRDG